MSDTKKTPDGVINEDAFAGFVREAREDSTTLRWAYALAIAAHLILLVVNFPTFTRATTAVKQKPKVYVIQQ